MTKKKPTFANEPIIMRFKIVKGHKVLRKGEGRVDQMFDRVAEFCMEGLGINSKQVERKHKYNNQDNGDE